MPELHINVQNPNELFTFKTTQFTEYTLRVYFYYELNSVVTPRLLTASETSTFYYFVNRSTNEVVEVEGTVVAGVNYVDFPFTVEKTAVDGPFQASVVISDATGNPEVMGDGNIELELNPGTGTNTELDTTIIVNWSSITNIGQVPWSIGNNITLISNCASSPYDVSITESGQTFMLSEDLDCDFTFNLPDIANAFSSTTSMVFSFYQANNSNVVILKAKDGEFIDDSSSGGTKQSVRNWGNSLIPGANIYVRPVSTTKWRTILQDSAFETT